MLVIFDNIKGVRLIVVLLEIELKLIVPLQSRIVVHIDGLVQEKTWLHCVSNRFTSFLHLPIDMQIHILVLLAYAYICIYVNDISWYENTVYFACIFHVSKFYQVPLGFPFHRRSPESFDQASATYVNIYKNGIIRRSVNINTISAGKHDKLSS